MPKVGGPNRLRMVVTGSSSFIGRHLSDAVRQDYEIFALTDCSQADCGAPSHPNITWFNVDLSDREALEAAFRRISESGGADVVIYLAASHDTEDTGSEELERVNLHGLRNVLELCRGLNPSRFILARSEERGSVSDSKTNDTCQEILEAHAGGLPYIQVEFASRPRIIVTGASGFIGRHLLDTLKDDFQVLALARCSQSECGAPIHPNIAWFQVDICDRETLAGVFRQIREGGGAELIIHLAAFYDFGQMHHPEYWRSNVVGLHNVLEESRSLGPKHFVFASSVAACDFPAPGDFITERSPADGTHTYAVTKRVGEKMLQAYSADFPWTIVRFAAVYSDWCEYPPLFLSLGTWLSGNWRRRILGGRGLFAIPYLHVREVATFMRRLLGKADELEPGQTLLASPDYSVSARSLFQMATRFYYGSRQEPLYLPRSACAAGMYLRDYAGRVTGTRPFERPWMARYIDRQLSIDASRTRQVLGWSPRERYALPRRLPFMIENLRTHPVEWHRRNRAAMQKLRPTTNLRIYQLLVKHEEEISRQFSTVLLDEKVAGGLAVRYRSLSDQELQLSHKMALHQLLNAVRTKDMAVYASFCRDLADRRAEQGFLAGEICGALKALGEICSQVLLVDEEAADLHHEIEDQIAMITLFGTDQVEETFDQLVETQVHRYQMSTGGRGFP